MLPLVPPGLLIFYFPFFSIHPYNIRKELILISIHHLNPFHLIETTTVIHSPDSSSFVKSTYLPQVSSGACLTAALNILLKQSKWWRLPISFLLMTLCLLLVCIITHSLSTLWLLFRENPIFWCWYPLYCEYQKQRKLCFWECTIFSLAISRQFEFKRQPTQFISIIDFDHFFLVRY